MNLTDMNNKPNDFVTRVLSTYLKFPEGQPITALDLRARDGMFLEHLTSKHKGERYMYGGEENYHEYLRGVNRGTYYKMFNASYKSEAKMSKDAFSLGIADCTINPALFNELFNTVDAFVEPDYEKRAKEALELETDELNLGDDGLTEEDIAKRKEEYQNRLEEATRDSKRAFRAAVRTQEKKIALIRDDQFLLTRITERLVPGGILVMLTPKELIDQNITVRLCNQYEDIRIFRPEENDYLRSGKCVIIGRKRMKNANDKTQGVLLAETKYKRYKEIEELEIQAQGMYEVPSVNIDEIETFRLGPLTVQEIQEIAKRSTLINTYQEKFSQVMTETKPIAPAALKKGHIMMLLTSGYLSGYIGEGPNKHLVKGSATKLSRTEEQVDDEGVTTWVEKEYYHISVKYLTQDGVFHRLM